MSYTKGLRVGYAGSTGTSIIDDAGFCVATVFPPDMKDGRNYDMDTAMADALMFVAGGPLLEALEDLLGFAYDPRREIPKAVSPRKTFEDAIDGARAAIALAKGEE